MPGRAQPSVGADGVAVGLFNPGDYRNFQAERKILRRKDAQLRAGEFLGGRVDDRVRSPRGIATLGMVIEGLFDDELNQPVCDLQGGKIRP